MRGQLINRGENVWQVRIPIGRGPDGKRLFHTKTIRGPKRDAQQYQTKVLRELDTQTFVDASQEPFSDFLRKWLETTVRQRVRERSYEDYKAIAARHLLPVLGHRPLSLIGPEEVQTLYSNLLDQGLSARTVRYAHSVLHGALEQAVKWRKIAANPSKSVDLPRQARREMRALTPEEAGRFLQASSGTKWHALWVLLLTTGLRPGEALALKWGDLDGERLRVQRSLSRGAKGAWRFHEPKSARGRRVVSLPASAKATLQAHRAQQNRARLQAGRQWLDHDLVFTSRHGEPLDYRVVVQRHFKPLAKIAELEDLRPYDLRHTCATLLLAAGENVKVVSERLGHASASITLDVYSHVLPDMQQLAAERMERVLFGQGT